MFLSLLLVAAQAAMPSPPLRPHEADKLGLRILLGKGGAKMVWALADARNVPLEQVFIRDATLMRRAKEIADVAGIEREVVVYTIPAWRDLRVVNIETHLSDERIIIMASPLLLEDSDEQGRDGMLAHELAHALEPCGPDFRSRSSEDACEQAVDLRAAAWVGKQASIRGLCQLMASAWYWRYTTDVSHVVERIKRLHHADLPR